MVLLFRVRRDDKHRSFRIADDLLGYAADQDVREARAAMRAGNN